MNDANSGWGSSGFGFQFRMELNANEPGMIGDFDDFRQDAVGRKTGEHEPMFLQLTAILDIHFVSMAVAF